MDKFRIALIVIPTVIGLFILIVVVGFISANNSETRLRNQITAKQRDNQNVYDTMIKTIRQNAEVTDAQAQAIGKVFTQYAGARATPTGSFAGALHETVPNLERTSQTFINLQNILTGARSSFQANQTALLDLKREHDDALTVFPSSVFCSWAGKQPIDVTIVTSDRTQNAFQTGVDNDTQVFPKK
jgi:hypothetical protein